MTTTRENGRPELRSASSSTTPPLRATSSLSPDFAANPTAVVPPLSGQKGTFRLNDDTPTPPRRPPSPPGGVPPRLTYGPLDDYLEATQKLVETAWKLLEAA